MVFDNLYYPVTKLPSTIGNVMQTPSAHPSFALST
jgi:hypothetical protein